MAMCSVSVAQETGNDCTCTIFNNLQTEVAQLMAVENLKVRILPESTSALSICRDGIGCLGIVTIIQLWIWQLCHRLIIST